MQTRTRPSKTITFIVPFPPGGVTDPVARMVGAKMAESVKQPVIVENKPGASGIIAAEFVKRAPADGHTLLMGFTGSHSVNPSLYSKLPYDPVKDFQPVTVLISTKHVLVVPAESPAKSVADLVALAKKSPNGLTFASQGVGAGGHLFDGEAETLVATTPAAPATAVDAWKAAGAEVLVCQPTTVTVGRALGAHPVAHGVDLNDLTRVLGERGVLELLVEGGPRLQASLWGAGLADRLVWYLATLAIGGEAAPGLLGGAGAATLADAHRLRLASVDRLGDDLRVVAFPRSTGGAAGAPSDPPKPSRTGGP